MYDQTRTRRLPTIFSATILLAWLLLLGGLPGLHAGYFTGVGDPYDSCSTGSGGGDPTHGTGPGVKGSAPGAGGFGGAVSRGVTSCSGCGGAQGGGASKSSGGSGTGCCGGDDSSGSGGGATAPNGSGWATRSSGMPTWEVSEPYINLWLYDEPLGYQPGIGPRLSFALAYKQRAPLAISPYLFSLGSNWTCAWLSYVEDDWYGYQATLMLARGGQITYSPPDGSTWSIIPRPRCSE